jgi:transposase
MKNDARKLSTEEQHLIRKLAIQRVHDGESVAEVTRSFGLGARTIFAWLRIVREKGVEALSLKVRTGRNRTLSDLEEQEIKRWVIGGDPRQHGFDFSLWTRQIVADLIFERFQQKAIF